MTFNEHPVLTKFFQHYHPASSFSDATDLYATADLVNMLWEQGCSIGAEELTSWMMKSGYRDEILEGLKTIWLLKAVSEDDTQTNNNTGSD